MHDMNLLPQTETVKRQSRLVLIVTIALNIGAAFWITTTTLTQNDLRASLEQSITATESRLTPIPPLTNQANTLRARVNDQEATNAYVLLFPNTTAPLTTRLTDTLTSFPTTDPPTATIDRIRMNRNDTLTDIEIAGKTKTLSTIQQIITNINNRGMSVLPPTINQEPDSTFTFTAAMTGSLTPNNPNQALDFIQPNLDPQDTTITDDTNPEDTNPEDANDEETTTTPPTPTNEPPTNQPTPNQPPANEPTTNPTQPTPPNDTTAFDDELDTIESNDPTPTLRIPGLIPQPRGNP